ncbi:MAG: c-type cytochrome [Candidatus Binataceae bacterium]
MGNDRTESAMTMGLSEQRQRVLVAQATRISVVLVFLACVASAAFGQETGKRDYMNNCAVCHGAKAKGNGPDLYMIPGIKPPDLTVLSKAHGGVFPFQAVEDAIDGREGTPSHERFDMPFWGVEMQEQGKEFTPESNAKVKARIDAIVKYLESLQAK